MESQILGSSNIYFYKKIHVSGLIRDLTFTSLHVAIFYRRIRREIDTSFAGELLHTRP